MLDFQLNKSLSDSQNFIGNKLFAILLFRIAVAKRITFALNMCINWKDFGGSRRNNLHEDVFSKYPVFNKLGKLFFCILVVCLLDRFFTATRWSMTHGHDLQCSSNEIGPLLCRLTGDQMKITRPLLLSGAKAFVVSDVVYETYGGPMIGQDLCSVCFVKTSRFT